MKKRMSLVLTLIMALSLLAVPGVSFAEGNAQPPAAPIVTAVATEKGKITVSWSDVGASSYVITRNNEETTTQIERTKVFEGLKKGTEYTFTVRGSNSAGTGAAGTAHATTWDVPSPPRNLTGMFTADGTGIIFQWEEPLFDGGTALTKYNLFIPDGEGTALIIKGSDSKSANCELQEGDLVEQAYITAENAVGASGKAMLNGPIAFEKINAGMPVISKDLDAAVNASYGQELTMSVEAEADKVTEEKKGAYKLSFQWYEAASADGNGAKAISGAVAASYTAKLTKTGTRYFYCEVTNTNDLVKVPAENKGQKTAAKKSIISAVTVGQKALNAAGIAVNQRAEIYRGDRLDLSNLLTVNTAAGAVAGETAAQVLDLANARVADGATVVFKKSGAAATASTIAYTDVINTVGSYGYTVTIPKDGSSTNYILNAPIAGEGTLTVKNSSSGGSSSGGSGGGGGGGSSAVHTVTYDPGEHGRLAEGARGSESVNGGSFPGHVPEVDAAEGWRFLGWSLDGKTIVDPAGQKIAGPTTFKALYAGNVAFDKKLDKPYIQGVGGGRFMPDSSISRAEMAAIVSQTLVNKIDPNGTYDVSMYSDVNPGAWYANYVGFLSQLKIVEGYSDGTFRPESPITRSEFAAMVIGVDGIVNGTNPFPDVRDDDWARKYIVSAYTKGYVSGVKNGGFEPLRSITRAEAVTIMNRVLGWTGEAAGEMPFVDVASDHWAYKEILKAAKGR